MKRFLLFLLLSFIVSQTFCQPYVFVKGGTIGSTTAATPAALKLADDNADSPNGYTLYFTGQATPATGNQARHTQIATAYADSRLTIKSGTLTDFAPRLQMIGGDDVAGTSNGSVVFDYGSREFVTPNASFNLRYMPTAGNPISMFASRDTTGLYMVPTQGKVGIGTTTPSALLDVNGTMEVGGDGIFWSRVSIYGTTSLENVTVSNGEMIMNKDVVMNDSVHVNGPMFIDGDLELNGTTYFDGPFRIRFNNGGNQVNMLTSEDTTGVYLVPTQGKVGVGTTTPEARLHISGTTLMQGDTEVDGNTSFNGPVNVNGPTIMEGPVNIGDVTTMFDVSPDSIVVVDGNVVNCVGKNVAGAAMFQRLGQFNRRNGNTGFTLMADREVMERGAYHMAFSLTDTTEDFFAFSHSGSENAINAWDDLVFINHEGLVGIGTNCPIADLHVAGELLVESLESGIGNFFVYADSLGQLAIGDPYEVLGPGDCLVAGPTQDTTLCLVGSHESDDNKILKIKYVGSQNGSANMKGISSYIDGGATGYGAVLEGGFAGLWAVDLSPGDGNGHAAVFTGDIEVSGSVQAATYLTSSDRKLKRDIEPLRNSLEKLMELEPKRYLYHTDRYSKMALPEGNQIGFIAQDVQEVFPELVHDEHFQDPAAPPTEDGIDYLAMNYVGLVPALVDGIQEQQRDILYLEDKVDQLEELNKVQRGELMELKSLLYAFIEEGVKDESSFMEPVLQENRLFPCIPNPTVDFTSIPLVVLEDVRHAEIVLTDVATGQEIKRVEVKERGYTKVKLETLGLSNGVYLYSLVVDGEFVGNRRLVIRW